MKAVALTPHQNQAPPITTSFAPPVAAKALAFTPSELAMSIGRNLALTGAPATLVNALGSGATKTVEALVDEVGSAFSLTVDVDHLGDAALNHVAHNVGVGVSGIYMERLGYFWRANGKEVLARVKGQGMPDYVWSTGLPSGAVVLSEAKGAAASGAVLKALDSRAEAGFSSQVRPWLTKTLTTGEPVVWGYGIGTHAAGGASSSTLVVYEPELVRANGIGTIDSAIPGPVPKVVLREHISSLFRLAGSDDLAGDCRRGSHERDRSVRLIRLVAGGREFVRGFDTEFDLPWFLWGRAWPLRYLSLAIEISAASRYLKLVEDGFLRGEGLHEARGLLTEPQDSDGLFLARDGLAFVETASSADLVTWVPGRGFN